MRRTQIRRNLGRVTVEDPIHLGLHVRHAGSEGAERTTAPRDPASEPGGRKAEFVAFHRRELDAILNIYGRMVAAGEWRDYAIDFLKDVAVFSIYRRTSEVPLYRVEKRPRLRERQGAYSVVTATGLILKRGHELAQVLRVFDRMLMKSVRDAG
ncbi:MAG TPA: DUF2794 domain-containing protein [Micropepsaceae bacterium]|nr:DUF2794 domain-containing protein [Micropepsaceae bacterium]